MQRVFFSAVLALLLVGTIGTSSADAQWRRGRGYYDGYSAYSYPAYSTYTYPAYSYPAYTYSGYYQPSVGVYYSSGYYGGRGYRGWRR